MDNFNQLKQTLKLIGAEHEISTGKPTDTPIISDLEDDVYLLVWVGNTVFIFNSDGKYIAQYNDDHEPLVLTLRSEE